jgi:tripartite-type tricarboxylate transporter receptor subunit TctC
MLSGQVQLLFAGTPESIEHIRAGKLRPLAVTDATRLEVLPDIPTVREYVPSYEAISFTGVGGPSNTPAEIVDKLNREINAALTDPTIKGRLADLGSTPFANSPAEFGTFLANETEKWGQVIRAANIKPE